MSGPFSGPVDRDQIIARIRAHPLGDQAAQQRTNFARLVMGEMADTSRMANEDVMIDGTCGVIVYFHGGGYAFGSPLTHSRIGTRLAELTGAQLVLPAYPLAPEHRWPTQLDAATAAVRLVLCNAPARIVLAGDSAGGHLALVTTLELARQGTTIDGLILFSPNTDRSGLSTTRARNDPMDPMVDDAADRRMARQCFGDMPSDSPQVSPVLDDLTLLPPTYIEVGSEEVLLGDSLVLAQRMQDAGATATLHVEPQGLHMGQLWTPYWPIAEAALNRAATFFRALV